MKSSVSVNVSVDGNMKEFFGRLKAMSSVDKRALFHSIGEGLRSSTIERFQNQTSPNGIRWEPSIRASAEGGKTLIQTSVLRGSIHTQANDEGVTVGTNDIRAATLQFGDERTIRAKKSDYLTISVNGSLRRVKSVNIKIPARQFLGISKEDEQEIKDAIEEAYDGK